MAPKCHSQVLFGKANDEDVLRRYKTKLDQVWWVTSQTRKHGCQLK